MTCADSFDPGAATAEQKATIADICGAESFDALPSLIRGAARRASRRLEGLLENYGSVRQT